MTWALPPASRVARAEKGSCFDTGCSRFGAHPQATPRPGSTAGRAHAGVSPPETGAARRRLLETPPGGDAASAPGQAVRLVRGHLLRRRVGALLGARHAVRAEPVQ